MRFVRESPFRHAAAHARGIVGLLTGMALALACSIVPSVAHSATPAEPGICDPKSLTMGTDAAGSITDSDTGIATYVGRNMVIGSTVGQPADGSGWFSNNGPAGSYAAEAEGTTVVKGDLLAHPLKGFFTLGMVAFGAQYLPPSNTTILTVGGRVSPNALGTNSVQAWQTPIGIKSVTKDGTVRNIYDASIAGSNTNLWGSTSATSLKLYDFDHRAYGTIHEKSGDLSHVSIGGQNRDMSSYSEHIARLSDELNTLASTGTVTTGLAPAGDETYYKYDGSKQYKLRFDASKPEKVLYLTGDGYSKSQVFRVSQSDLDTTGYRGLDFRLTRIPADATVLINVDGKQIQWRNGWRIWWNNQQIGNGFSTSAPASAQSLYTKTAQRIMWNFHEAEDQMGSDGSSVQTPAVRILGGQTFNGSANGGISSSDDPAAALLGSVLVPHGSFDDHVTTNGRVWVGGDFYMDDPQLASGISSASAIDMDQERHNLPWNGTITSSCSAVQWKKTDVTGRYALGGSGWGIYKTLADAQQDADPILYVYDNGSNDASPATGVIQVNNLTPNATYYMRETAWPEGHQADSTVYAFTTASTGESMNRPVRLDGSMLPTTADGATYITNTLDSVHWKKRNAAGAALAGSSWKITGSDGSQYSVTDSTGTVSSITVSLDDPSQKIGEMTTAHAHVRFADPQAANDARVQWRSSDPSVATIAPDGTITAGGAGTTEIFAYCGRSYAQARYTVVGDRSSHSTGVLTILGTNQMVVDASQFLRLEANNESVDPSSATWTSSNPSVASVDASGEVSAHAVGTTRLTASWGGMTDHFTLTVAKQYSPDDQPTTSAIHIYYAKDRHSDWSQVYIHYSDGQSWTTKPQPMTSNGNWWTYTITPKGTGRVMLIFGKNDSLTNNQWDKNGGGNFAPDMDHADAIFSAPAGSGPRASDSAPSDAQPIAVRVADAKGNEVSTLALASGQTMSLHAQPVYRDGHFSDVHSYSVAWASSNPAVASVDSTGTVRAVAPGHAVLTATIGSLVARVSVSVASDKSTIIVNARTLQMTAGQQQILTASVNGKSYVPRWTSSDPTIAAIDPGSGLLVAKKPGTVVITAHSTTGSAVSSGTIAISVRSMIPVLTDTDDAPGEIGVVGLPNGEYTVTEETAPAGYSLSTKSYRFTIAGGKLVAGSTDDDPLVEITVGGASGAATDTVIDAPLVAAWKKEDVLTHGLLSGAVWQLTQTASQAKDSGWDDAHAVASTWCVADKTGSSTPAWSTRQCQQSGNGSVLVDTDGEAGVIRITGLRAGAYTLSEVVAPLGHDLLSQTFSLVMTEDGLVSLVPAPQPGSGSVANGGTSPARGSGASCVRRSYYGVFATTNSDRKDSEAASMPIVYDEESTGSASWTKADKAHAEKLLGGSEWELSGSNTYTVADTGATKTIKKSFTVSDAGSAEAVKACTPKRVGKGPRGLGVLCDTDPRPGRFSVAGLDWGTWTLTETKAPEGYLLATGSVTGRIGVTNSSFVPHIDFGAIKDTERSYHLPNSGGPSVVVLMTALGFLLLLTAATSLAIRKKR